MEDKKWLIIGIIIISALFILKIGMLNIFMIIWIFGTLFMPYIIGIINSNFVYMTLVYKRMFL